MTVREEVLALLMAEREAYISGQYLADRLHVSRNAVWKAIQVLRDEGIPIEAVRQKGYRIAPDQDLLNAAGVRRFIQDAARFEMHSYDAVSSTNDLARQLAESDAPAWSVVLADMQHSGRGRMGRDFHSPAGSGIYLSVVLRPAEVAESSLITIAAATAVVEAIEDVCGVACDIKWVNDCYVNGRKVAGILTEAAIGLEDLRLRYAVVGIGINVYAPDEGFPEALQQTAGAVMSGPSTDVNLRNRLTARLLEKLYVYENALGARAYLEGYRRRLFIKGQQVMLVTAQEKELVTVVDVDENGFLEVHDTQGALRKVSSGEVSLQLQG